MELIDENQINNSGNKDSNFAAFDLEENTMLSKSDKKCKSIGCLWCFSIILTIAFVFTGIQIFSGQGCAPNTFRATSSDGSKPLSYCLSCLESLGPSCKSCSSFNRCSAC